MQIENDALAHIHKFLNGKQHLRIFLKNSGCNGFEFIMEPIHSLPDYTYLIYHFDNFSIVIDTVDYMLSDLKITLVKDGLNYKISMSLPNQTSVCGCGKSFSIS